MVAGSLPERMPKVRAQISISLGMTLHRCCGEREVERGERKRERDIQLWPVCRVHSGTIPLCSGSEAMELWLELPQHTLALGSPNGDTQARMCGKSSEVSI